METCKSGSKISVLHSKATDEGWDPYRLVILVLRTLFLHEHFHRRGLGSIDTCKSGGKHAVLHAQIHR